MFDSAGVITAAPNRASIGSVRAAAIGHVGLGLFIGLFVVIALIASSFVNHKFNITMATLFSGLLALMVAIYLMVSLVVSFITMALFVKPDSPSKYLIEATKRNFLRPERLWQSFLSILLVAIFTSTFTYLKDVIPLLHPFSWDQTFATLDRLIFFGLDAWDVTFAIFGNPTATTAINAVYNGWFFVIYMALLSAIFGYSNSSDRLQFLYAFLLVWAIGGILFATIFSSAGPVYFARLGLGHEFEPQMELLRQFNQISPVWALDVQNMLWDGHTKGGGISGISAFPSLHVGSSVVVTLYAMRLNRWLGYAMIAFTTIILIGSVHLAWHYAVDGIFSLILAPLCWKFAGGLMRLDLAWQRHVLAHD